MTFIGKFSCPSCGANGQSFNVVKALMRRCSTTCTNCKKSIVSNLSYGRYIGLLIYVEVIVALTAVPFFVALVGERWLIAVAAFAIFVLLVFPPAILLHARNARTGQ